MIHGRVKAEKAIKRNLRLSLGGLLDAKQREWAATCLWLDVVQPMLKSAAKEVIPSMPKCKSKKGKGKKGGGK